MARRRKYGEDLTYAEEHRLTLEQLYRRIGHRLDMADRDFTEFCHWCKQPLLLVEEVRDKGQDLRDKATTVTRKLANMAGIHAVLCGWRTERPKEVQDEIDRLNTRLRQLESEYPIVGFKVRLLAPEHRAEIEDIEPSAWWEYVLHTHRRHHLDCQAARGREIPVAVDHMYAAAQRHPLAKGRLWLA